MARGRMLNKKISTSHKANLLPCRAYALFCTMIAHLDVNGVGPGEPVVVKAMIVPLREEQTIASITDDLRLMHRLSLIKFFHDHRVRYSYFPGFLAEQVGLRKDKEQPVFPVPPWLGTKAELDINNSDQKTENGRNQDGKWTENGRNFDGQRTDFGRAKVKVKEKEKVNSLTGEDKDEVEVEGVPATASASLPDYSELYRKNIGTLTPLIENELSEIATTCPPDYFEFAIHEAVVCNILNLSYIKTILRRLEKEGLPC